MQYLFRGKRVDNGEWVEGDLVQWPDGDREIVAHNGTSNAIKYRVIPETVGMYTGLRDGTGNRIFTGDLYKNEFCQHVFRVMFISGAFVGGVSKDQCSVLGWGPDERSKDTVVENTDWMTVIGNIHDNPELVKPAQKESVTNTMNTAAVLDPGTQTAEGQENVNSTESAAQDTAMEVTQESAEEAVGDSTEE